ncbi:hypothetical protein [Paraburkholderia solisilvae]|uniref:Uncharacterized protein n=1 Tax=Paraburkholderia solisilvae TaxID=624376 RepID=A0A6J5ED14_9BURK|nr:hypothetical protein [Paraburkholderia solisilvae]CAB3764510.1 hypothetical protein LMG29739_04374 [Paraburkholderia solisilvae]
MNLFGRRFGGYAGRSLPTLSASLVPYGMPKADGSHDHRFNRGKDRTPAQKRGDAKRTTYSK